MSTKFSAFDVDEYLDSDEAIAAYLSEAIDENDSDLLLSVLADIARAERERGIVPDAFFENY